MESPWTPPVLRWKEIENLWKPTCEAMWVPQSSDLLSHADKQEKETLTLSVGDRFHCSGGVRFPSRDSFLTPFGSRSPEPSVR